ncbi:MAG: lactonase family protein [Myxococcota bacterium]
MFAYVGSSDGDIHGYDVDRATGALTPAGAWPAGSSPSFLALTPDRRFLVAVCEGSDELVSFAVDPATGALSQLDRTSSDGRGPAHVAIDSTGGHVLAANYGDGAVTMVALAPDGTFGAREATLDSGANAHQVALAPGNDRAFVPNLGDDDVSQLLFDPVAGTLGFDVVAHVAVASGAGPRHLAFHPTAPWAWLLGETDDTLTTLAVDASGRLSVQGAGSTLPAGADGNGNYTAELALDPTGRTLYASNRGDDSIARFSVDPATGAATLLDTTPTQGSWPRHFSLDPDGALLAVGNQRSDTVVVFAVDPATGALAYRTTTAVAGPAFVGIVALP